MTTQHVLVTSGILAVFMCIIVVIFTPAIARSRRGATGVRGTPVSPETLSIIALLKVFAVAFVGCWVIVSARCETDANTMMTNMLKTGPDF